MLSKDELRLKFQKEWEKHYSLNVLKELGFKRRRCKKCGRYFWSVEERELCGDPACIGYEFIGNPPSNLKLGYVETWKRIEKYFVENGHGSIEPYPTVARWRDDLYFTIASINDFQPYVVRGEIEPPANPLIVPQPCIRFSDVENVGVTGRHYTNFVMIGQHAFNTEKTGLFYWKEEAIRHDINYLTKAIGIPLEKLVFHEDVWMGGGNFGPSMEYFAGGLELGNCVFMQYEILPDGYRELKTKVIDMGAGLSRLAWITHGSPTSYEIVLGKAVDKLKDSIGINIDEKLYLEYVKLSGSLTTDEVDVVKEKERIAKQLGLDESFFKTLEPLQAAYAIGDHLLTLLFTVTDGMMPSNSGGGYNLRMLLRRVFGFEEKYGFDIDYNEVLELLINHLTGLFDRYKEGVDVTARVVEEERKKYRATKEKAKRKIEVLMKKKKIITKEDLILLYKSYGIPPEYIEKEASQKGIKVYVPQNFYQLVKEKEELEKKEEHEIDVSKYPATQKIYYELTQPEFEAEVLGIEGNYIILNKTNFYPESGGQVGDTGYLNDVKVLNTIKDGNVVLHEVKEPEAFKKGMKVKGVVDWQRRVDITRHHTVTHLVTAAARQILGKHVWQAGAKKDEFKAHIDLTHYKRITDEELKAIEMKVNEFIMQNAEINVYVMPRNEAERKYGFTIYQGGAVPGKELRIVEIKGIDVEACGGTHHLLKRTGEIGPFKIIKRESVKDGVERLVYKAGRRAVEYIQQREELLKNSSSILKVPEAMLPKTVERFFNEWKERGKKIEELTNFVKKDLKGVVELPLTIKDIGKISGDIALLLKDGIVLSGRYAEKGDALKQKLNIKGGGTNSFYVLKGGYDKRKAIELLK